MDEKFKILGFVVLFFIAIFSTETLDNALKPLLAENEWWNLVVAIPLLITLIGTGFFLERIKSLIKFAFLGASCLLIFVSTQAYFVPEEFQFEWNIWLQSWAEIGAYFGIMFSGMFIATLVFLSVGRVFRYLYDLFFASSEPQTIEL